MSQQLKATCPHMFVNMSAQIHVCHIRTQHVCTCLLFENPFRKKEKGLTFRNLQVRPMASHWISPALIQCLRWCKTGWAACAPCIYTCKREKTSPLDHRVVHTHTCSPFWGVACFPKRMKLISSIMYRTKPHEKILTPQSSSVCSMKTFKLHQRKESGVFTKRHFKVQRISQSVCK